MSLSAIDAIQRERRLAAMRAEVEASHNAHPPHVHPHGGYDPNQPRVPKGRSDGGRWTSTVGASDIERTADSPHSQPPETTTLAASWRPALPIPLPSPPPPIPPEVWEDWKRRGEQSLNDLIKIWLRVFKQIRGGGGGRGRSGRDTGEDRDECNERWEEEYARCDIFRPFGARWRDACRVRATDRMRLCYRNGGTPDPNEPPEYDWKDIPRDDPRRPNE
jgi:hypothetical protein